MKNSSINKTLIGLTAIVAFSVVGSVHGYDCYFANNEKLILPIDNAIIGERTYTKNDPTEGYWQYNYAQDENPGPCEFECKNGYNLYGEYTIINGEQRNRLYCAEDAYGYYDPAEGKRFSPRKTTLSSEDKQYINESDKKLTNNTLTDTMWNELMDGLNNIGERLYTIEKKLQYFKTNFRTEIMEIVYEKIHPAEYNIPSGAIMAFNLSECPEGWKEFSQADGKFLMGGAGKRIDKVYYNLGDTGGSNSIKLKADQLPEHHHYMFGPKNSQDNDSEAYRKSHYIGSQDKRFIAGDTDRINMSQYKMKTIREETSSSTYTRNDESKVRAGLTSSKLVDTGGNYISQQSIDIKNPYIAILYCIKK